MTPLTPPARHPRKPRQPRQTRKWDRLAPTRPGRALHGRSPAPAPHTAAFTLIEVLVTVSIIVVLMSLGLVVGARMQANARLTEARTLLLRVQTVADEYEAATADRMGRGLKINHSAQDAHGMGHPAPIDWKDSGVVPSALRNDPANPAAAARVTSQRFVWAVSRIPQTRELLLASVGRKHLRVWTDPSNPDVKLEYIADPWDTPLFYAAFVDHDDNIEFDDFLPQRKAWTTTGDYRATPADIARWRPFFVSAGPSEDFTNLADNIYSYDLERTADEQADEDATN
jgi:prepilin-type N-terminal cleavage/methylation domain-containing protein